MHPAQTGYRLPSSARLPLITHGFRLNAIRLLCYDQHQLVTLTRVKAFRRKPLNCHPFFQQLHLIAILISGKCFCQFRLPCSLRVSRLRRNWYTVLIEGFVPNGVCALRLRGNDRWRLRHMGAVLGILWLGGNVSCLCGLRGCGTGWNALLFDGWYISLNVVKYI